MKALVFKVALTDDPQAPWGGFKFFGVGREYGRTGSRHFLNRRQPSSDRFFRA